MVWGFSDTCKNDIKQKMDEGLSPKIVIVSECLITEVVNPFNGKVVTKE